MNILSVVIDTDVDVRFFVDDNTDEVWIHARDWWERLLGRANTFDALKAIKNKKFKRWCRFSDSIGRSQKQRFINQHAATILAIRSEHPKAETFVETVADITVKLLRGEARLVPTTLAAPRKLSEHAQREVQILNSKRVNGQRKEIGGTEACIQYNKYVCMAVSDLHVSPSVYRRLASIRWHLTASQSNSGAEVLRHVEPWSAATMSFHKELVLKGHTPRSVTPVALKAKEVFKGMLGLGVIPAELLESFE